MRFELSSNTCFKDIISASGSAMGICSPEGSLERAGGQRDRESNILDYYKQELIAIFLVL
jgi:hypothetical protein